MVYLAANSTKSALEALQSDDIAVVAGCTDWFPALGDNPAPENLLDVTKIPEFRGITRVQNGWRLGAAATWSDVIRSDLPACFDGLKACARDVGSVQIQNVATIAGNICNASPAADGVPPLLALDAQVEIVSRTGMRRVPLGRFITGVRKTSLPRGELVSGLIVADLPATARSSFIKLGSRKYLVISIAMVGVVIDLDRGGQVVHAAVAVGACSPVARRMARLEDAVIGLHRAELTAPHLITPDLLSSLSPIEDVRGSAEFRIKAVAELCQRAIVAAAGDGRG